MTNPRFSIVIPTRDRHETLLYTLKSCLGQEFFDYEIVVSDNGTTDETKRLVDSIVSPKVKYVRTPKPFAMTNSFEFAVSHANGEYVIVIGDDDGLLPYSLVELNKLIEETQEKVIRWEIISYNWPNTAQPGSALLSNRVIVPQGGQSGKLDSYQVINNVLDFQINYCFLPMLYHSAVHRDVLGELKARTGKIYQSLSPDIYTGFSIAYLVKQYYYSALPFSISALSHKSNGNAHVFSNHHNPVVKDFTILNEKDEIFCHPKVPYIKCCPVAVADSFRVSKEALFPTEHQLDYDRQQLIMECIVEAKEFSDADRQEHIHLISQSLQDDPILFQWFEDSIKPNMDQIRREIKRNFPVPFLSPRFHGANALEEYGVQDVYELGFACCPLVGFPHYQAQTVMT